MCASEAPRSAFGLHPDVLCLCIVLPFIIVYYYSLTRIVTCKVAHLCPPRCNIVFTQIAQGLVMNLQEQDLLIMKFHIKVPYSRRQEKAGAF